MRQVTDAKLIAARYVRSDLQYDAPATIPFLAIAHALPSTGGWLGSILLMFAGELRVVLRLSWRSLAWV